jgi:predicted nucleotidyltransferase component of viral defense system
MSELRVLEEHARNLQTSVENVLREEIQKKVLQYLFMHGFFTQGIFQGGTALRLLYNNPRYSEDLDFVFKKSNSETFQQIENFFKGIEKNLKATLDFVQDVEVQNQKSTDMIKRINLRFKIKSYPKKLRLQCEFVNIQAYTSTPKNMVSDITIVTESVDEILADKIVAVFLRDYVKGRDLWDIYYLFTQLNANIDGQLVSKKILDYGTPPTHWEQIMTTVITKVNSAGLSALKQEMLKFMPGRVFEIYSPLFPDVVEVTCKVLKEVAHKVSESEVKRKKEEIFRTLKEKNKL